MKLEPESRKQLLRIAGGTAICTAAMWVLFAALHLVGWVKSSPQESCARRLSQRSTCPTSCPALPSAMARPG